MVNPTVMRLLLALASFMLTLSAAMPADMLFSQLGSLPVEKWLSAAGTAILAYINGDKLPGVRK